MQRDKTVYKRLYEELKKKLVFILVQSTHMIAVASVAIYMDRLKEFIFMFTAFTIAKKIFGKSYHAPTLTLCVLVSMVSFGVLCKITPSLNTSLIIQSLLGVLLAYGSYLLEMYGIKQGWFKDDGDDKQGGD